MPTSALAQLPLYAHYSTEIADAVLDEAARFAGQVLAPLNAVGDRHGAQLEARGVVLPDPVRAAYQAFAGAGWTQLGVDIDLGGQGMPQALTSAVEEMWHGANMAFALCPMLSHAATEALRVAGSAPLRARYLPQLIDGSTTGSMNLTEPQAGSDLAAVRTRAVAAGDAYLVQGQKIFITYGDHNLTDNILHLVLARIDGAPAGVRGLSLFLVPKLLPGTDGSLQDNQVRCLSIEHKLGIHASPTCAMSFGDQGGSIFSVPLSLKF